MLKGTTKIMARTVRRSIGQQRTVACEIRQQILLLEQFTGVENSKRLCHVKRNNKLMVRTVRKSMGQQRTV